MTHFPNRFAGKVALVTGAAQGIGREAMLRLAREGAQVGASTAPAAAQIKAPPIASSTGRVRSACVDQGVGSGVAMSRMAAQIP